jgi:hypothetical protein
MAPPARRTKKKAVSTSHAHTQRDHDGTVVREGAAGRLRWGAAWRLRLAAGGEVGRRCGCRGPGRSFLEAGTPPKLEVIAQDCPDGRLPHSVRRFGPRAPVLGAPVTGDRCRPAPPLHVLGF